MMKRYRTHVKEARRLGSAKSGLHHWWMQRLTAIALVPLTLWFIFSVIHLGGDYAAAVVWASRSWNFVLLSLLLVFTFYHLVLGVQVVIEDYIHCEVMKLVMFLALRFVSIVGVVVGFWSIFGLAF